LTGYLRRQPLIFISRNTPINFSSVLVLLFDFILRIISDRFDGVKTSAILFHSFQKKKILSHRRGD